MARNTDNLSELRRQVDEIDDAIHDLIMRRTELARDFANAKNDGGPILRPAREAQVIRRLVARHRGSFPTSVLVRVWREIISAFASLQGPFAAAAYVSERTHGEPELDLRGLAREHFGSETPIAAFGREVAVLRAVTDRKATVGIVPVPESEMGDPWWMHLASTAADAPRIIARLPFARVLRGNEPSGLVITLADAEESGHDHSYMIVETFEAISRGALLDLLSNAGFEIVAVQSWNNSKDHPLSLIEIEGFLGVGDPRIVRLLDIGKERIGRAWPVGSYAVPLTPEELKVAGEKVG